MEHQYPKFTPEMKKTHTILIPNMAVTQFRLLKYALEYDGYKCEILGNCGSAVAQLGLKYVHNDTCYPALLVIGQFLDALNSGKYRSRTYGPAHHPDGRRLPCFQLHPPAAQGTGQGRLPGDPGGQPELLGSGKRQRLPDDAAAGPPRAGLHLLWRYALRPAQPDRPL